MNTKTVRVKIVRLPGLPEDLVAASRKLGRTLGEDLGYGEETLEIEAEDEDAAIRQVDLLFTLPFKGQAREIWIGDVQYGATAERRPDGKIYVPMPDYEQLARTSDADPSTARDQSDAVLFKDEGEGGPVYVRRDGEVLNYEDTDAVFLGRPRAKWFTRADAERIAEQEGLPFEES